MVPPLPLSVIVLTRDEAANVGECLDAILLQLREGDEVIVLDSASRDATVPIVQEYARLHPDVVRLHAYPRNVSFGKARNDGVDMARHEVIVFVSADAVPEPGWLAALRRAAEGADIVYGKQKHAPPDQNVPTVARGLRYHHFESKREGLPERYASNVNAAYTRFAFQTLRFDDELPGSEDVAFARRARLAGLRIAYTPDAVVRHKDVAGWLGEWRKHVREGAAHALRRDLLGAPRMHLAWALAVALLSLATAASGSVWLLAPTVLAFFAPALRRAFSPVARQYRPLPLLASVTASPFFDLAFVASYLGASAQALVRRRSGRTG